MEHYYRKIKGFFDFENIYRKAIKDFPSGSHFVEIGCWRGTSTCFMAVEIINSGKQITFDCVDLWDYSGEEYERDDLFPEKKKVYENFLTNIKPVKQVVRHHKMDSVEASKLFKDGSLDFIYIDASHSFVNVVFDLWAWYPKLRWGGLIAGHDYDFPEVKAAVDGFFLKKKIETLTRSWMYYKN